MRLAADRPEAHGASGEPLDDLRSGLDLVQAERGLRIAEPHEAAQGQVAFGLVVDGLGEGQVLVGQVASHGMLQTRNRLRRPSVALTPETVGVDPAHIEHVGVDRQVAIGVSVPPDRLLGDLHQARPLDGGGGSGEVGVDELARQAHSVKDLGAAVGLVGRNAHLGHDLQNALADGLDVVLAHLIGGLRQAVARPEVLKGLEGEVGVDRLGAIAGKDAEVMHLAGLTRLNHQSGLHAQSLADQVMMDRRSRQGGGDRDPVARCLTVRKDQDVAVGEDLVGGRTAEALDRRLKPRRPFRSRPGRVEGRGAERAVEQLVDRSDLGQVLVGQDGLRDFEPLMGAGLSAEQVRTRADHRDEAHDQFLADRVDRWVRYLREILLEVVVEQLGALREDGDWEVRAHGAHGIVA